LLNINCAFVNNENEKRENQWQHSQFLYLLLEHIYELSFNK
jgi:hypothetical protein